MHVLSVITNRKSVPPPAAARFESAFFPPFPIGVTVNRCVQIRITGLNAVLHVLLRAQSPSFLSFTMFFCRGVHFCTVAAAMERSHRTKPPQILMNLPKRQESKLNFITWKVHHVDVEAVNNL